MPKAVPPSLTDLRVEIDRIDREIHALLKARADVVTQVAAAKAAAASAGAPAPAFRPGREADVLRALAARHSGPFALPSLVRIWREIMSGMTQMQQQIVVAVHRPERGDGAGWDAARDHFGLGMTYKPFRRARDVVAAVRDGAAGIGVAPAPGDEDGEEPWWPALAADSSDLPRIVLKFPILGRPAAGGRAHVALALPGPEPEAVDAAYLAVEAAAGTTRDRLAAALAAAGLSAGPPIAAPDTPCLYLVEAACGWPAAVHDAAIRHITPVGGYPAPIGEA